MSGSHARRSSGQQLREELYVVPAARLYSHREERCWGCCMSGCRQCQPRGVTCISSSSTVSGAVLSDYGQDASLTRRQHKAITPPNNTSNVASAAHPFSRSTPLRVSTWRLVLNATQLHCHTHNLLCLMHSHNTCFVAPYGAALKFFLRQSVPSLSVPL
ncbi:hypothetical protein E2C01_085527 [Portunus trituberculatus]|uniref:Uncharacterized protein n=1 Tax=Portunus trituberculatus TaxID=210409 RepID=A0A5B7J948_PORTR|nr:hypothetical protein [Portunus trituberculatus]